jgi:hypothetical protein
VRVAIDPSFVSHSNSAHQFRKVDCISMKISLLLESLADSVDPRSQLNVDALNWQNDTQWVARQ